MSLCASCSCVPVSSIGGWAGEPPTSAGERESEILPDEGFWEELEEEVESAGDAAVLGLSRDSQHIIERI
jgi:hypothetical protein